MKHVSDINDGTNSTLTNILRLEYVLEKCVIPNEHDSILSITIGT